MKQVYKTPKLRPKFKNQNTDEVSVNIRQNVEFFVGNSEIKRSEELFLWSTWSRSFETGFQFRLNEVEASASAPVSCDSSVFFCDCIAQTRKKFFTAGRVSLMMKILLKIFGLK